MESYEYVVSRIRMLELRYVRIAMLKKKHEEIVFIRRLNKLKQKVMIEYAVLVAELQAAEQAGTIKSHNFEDGHGFGNAG